MELTFSVKEKLGAIIPNKETRTVFLRDIEEKSLYITEIPLYPSALAIGNSLYHSVRKLKESESILLAEGWDSEDFIVHADFLKKFYRDTPPYILNFSSDINLGISCKISDIENIDTEKLNLIFKPPYKKAELSKLDIKKVKNIYLLKYPYSEGGVIYLWQHRKELKNKLKVLYNPLQETLNNEFLRTFTVL